MGTRYCEVCEKELNVYDDGVGKKGKATSHIVSDEGAFYLNKWFCNDCWKEILGGTK